MTVTRNKLAVYRILLNSCNINHENCLGKCNGGVIPLSYREISVRLPESWGTMFVGHHFHTGYNYDTNRWTVQSDDCEIKVASIAAEDAVQRYFALQYDRIQALSHAII